MDILYKFTTIKIKESTAKKFRTFSRKISRSQSDTLEIMLNFFKENEVSPFESIGPTVGKLEDLIKKRINGLVAIIKNIEKSQTKPTYSMIQLLFQENAKQKKPRLVEKKFMNRENTQEEEQQTKLLNYQNQVLKLKDEFDLMKFDYKNVINQTNYVKTTFSKGYYKLEITQKQFEELKLKLNDVHDNHYTSTFR